MSQEKREHQIGGRRANPPTAAQVRRRRWRYRALLGLCVAVMLFSGYQLIATRLEYQKGADFYQEMEDAFLTAPDESEPPDLSPAPPPTDTPSPTAGETPEESPTPPESPSPSPSPTVKLAPDIWPAVDFDGLRGRNADTAAWLLCPGTRLNYPVVYSHDNEEYLNRLFGGQPGKAGTLFIDMRNRAGFVDRNTIIYGHHMRDGSMFGLLTEYKTQSFYDAHPVIRLVTEAGRYEIALFAGFVADMTDTAVWSVVFASDEAFLTWVEGGIARSTFQSDVTVAADDRVVLLSTCSYEFTGARYVAIGKLVPLDGQ